MQIELIKTLLEMRQELDTLRNRPVPCPNTTNLAQWRNLQQGLRQRRKCLKLAVPQPFTGKRVSKLDAFEKWACYMYIQATKDEFEG